MKLRPTILSACLLLVTLTDPLGQGTARACDPPPSGAWVGEASQTVPADGVVLLRIYCYDCASEISVNLTVTDPDGQPVPGSVLQSELNLGNGWVAWQPDEDFEEGARYFLEFDGADDLNQVGQAGFVASAPLEGSGPDVELAVDGYASHHLIGERVCCEDADRDSCGQLPCFTDVEEVVERVVVRIQWYDSEDSTPLQFAYRGRFFNDDQDEWTEWTPDWLAGSAFELADEYCWELYARALVGGDEVLVGNGCVSHEQLDIYPIEQRIADEERYIQQCTVPPKGYEEQWCESFETQLATRNCDGVNTSGCQAALAACEASGSGSETSNAVDGGVTSDAGAPTPGDDAGMPATGGNSGGNPGGSSSSGDGGSSGASGASTTGNAGSGSTANQGGGTSTSGSSTDEPDDTKPDSNGGVSPTTNTDAGETQLRPTGASDSDSSSSGCSTSSRNRVGGSWTLLLLAGLAIARRKQAPRHSVCRSE